MRRLRATAVAVVACVAAATALDGSPQDGAPRFPPVGVAVEEDDGRWCAEFPEGAGARVTEGSRVAVVFPDGAESLVWTARVAGIVAGACRTAFAQPRWHGYTAYRLEETGTPAAGTARKTLGLAIVSEAPWRRTPNGALRADLDGDGLPEEARRCAADEGEHFTIWTIDGAGRSSRRGHEYFDWGAVVERTCGPGEDGR